MSVFTSLTIILLAMVIQAFMQLTPGIFMIFYHHSLGKTSNKKADDRSLSFILGAEICIAIIFLAIYIIVSFFVNEKDFPSNIFLWIMFGIFLLEAIITFFFYFRPRSKKIAKSKNTTILFIPRHITENLIYHAEQTKNRSDTIVLGMVACVFELIFTLPLYIISSVAIFNISINVGFVFIVAYIIIATIPLFTIRTLFRTGHNLAEIQRSRVRKKTFFRLVISISFLLLAILIFTTIITR
ncbi:MAG: hypothetical protein Q4A36_01620 [Candidatus Saccharibacteria bacterium]|nr:hypothetical protein [Candidatus Saccharibacteria bacterium]